jgi:hypothetical protein
VKIAQEIVDFEVKRARRLTFPAGLVEDLRWWTDESPEPCVLLKFVEAGRVVVMSWEEHGPTILARKNELEKKIPDEEAEDALLSLENRYFKNPIERSWRITLPVIAMAHLFGFEPYEKTVFVARRSSQLEVRSLAFRNQQLLEPSRFLEDLP